MIKVKTLDQPTSAFFESMRKPILAGLLSHRTESLVLGLIGAAQIGLVTSGAPGFPCPFKAMFGIPCPGCGVSTAVSLLLHGDWQTSLQTHAFAPVFLGVVVFFLAAGLLPEPLRARLIPKVAWLEQRTAMLF